MSTQATRKTALVTGSTQGIGKSIGLSLLNKGCFVIFNYSHSSETAAELAKELDEQYPNQYAIIKADLSTQDGVNQLVAESLKIRSTLDYLILNAGTTNRKPFGEISIDEWNQVFSTNLTMPFFLTQTLSPHLNQGGGVIFIGSLMGKYPHSLSITYGVSKAGVHILSKYLVKYFSDRKITVNTIIPGFVDTPWQKTKPTEIRQSIERKVALGRFAEPDEIAKACISILENPYINGSEIVIDGGYCYQ